MPAIGCASCGLLSQSVEQARQRAGLAALRQQSLGAFAGAGDTRVECLAQPLQRLFLVGLVAGEKNGRWYISETSQAYRKIYPIIQKAFNEKEKIIVEVKNEIGDAKDKDGKLNLAKLG